MICALYAMESFIRSSDFDGEVDVEQPGNRHSCGPCKIQTNSNITGDWYCTQCDDFLCSDCKSWHGAIKATSAHEIISAGNITVHSCGPCRVKDGTTVKASQYCVDCDDFLCAGCKQRHASLKATEKHVLQSAVKTLASKSSFTKLSTQRLQVKGDCHTTDTYSADITRRAAATNPMKDRTATFEKSFHVRASDDNDAIHVAGSTILFDSKQLLLTDYFNKKLKMFDADARLVSFKQFDKEPWDVAVFCTSEMAVTFPTERKIRRLTMDGSFAEKGCISTRARCYGVAYINEDKIAITEAYEGALLVMRIDGSILSTLKVKENGEDFFSVPWHLTLNRSRTVAYVSDYGNNAVYAFDLERNNKIVFIYKHKQLQGPSGVTLDTDGNVYVCGADSKNVHQISPAGRFIKILLTRETDRDINRPWTVCFGPDEDYFILTGDNMEDLAQYKFQ